MGRNTIAATVLGAALCLTRGASAQPILVGRPPEWGIAAGYGTHVKIGPGRTDFGVAVLSPSVSFRLSSRLEFVASATFEHYVSPSAYFVGVLPVGARLYLGNEKFYPYLGLGLGGGWTDLDDKVFEISRRFNFRIEGSFGLKFPSGGTSAWTVEGRYQHTSNAGTVFPNQGLNSIVGIVGFRFR